MARKPLAKRAASIRRTVIRKKPVAKRSVKKATAKKPVKKTAPKKSVRMPKIVVFRLSPIGRWLYRIESANGTVLAQSYSSYASKSRAVETAKSFQAAVGKAKIEVVI